MASTPVPDVNWRFEAPEKVIGNDSGAFDTWRQSGTLGPEPESPPTAPPETGGDVEKAR